MTWKFFQAEGYWRKEDSGWKLWVPQWQFNDDNLQLTTAFNLDLPFQGNSSIDFLGGFQLTNVNLLQNYLPKEKLSAGVYQWLSEALSQGAIKGGKVVFRGPLTHFPYQQQEGIFEIVARLQDMDMKYDTHWPVLQNMSGRMDFINNAMHIFDAEGEVSNNHLTRVKADIDDLSHADLIVSGQVKKGNLSHGIDFLKNTPLPLAQRLSNIQMQGLMDLQLKITIPLEDAEAPVLTEGSIFTHQGQFQLPQWKMAITDIDGLINFTPSALFAKDVKVNIGGQPATINIATDHRDDHVVFKFDMQGKVDMSDLKKQFKLPLLNYFSGSSSYKAQLNLDESATHPLDFNLTSDLKGIDIQFDNLYKKSAAEPTTFTVDFKNSENDLFQLFAQYDSTFSAAAQFKKSKNSLKFLNGEINIGKDKADFPTDSGLVIKLDTPLFDWTQWKPLLSAFSGGENQSSVNLQKLELKTNKLLAFDHTFEEVDVQLFPEGDNWRAHVDTPIIEGDVYLAAQDQMSHPITAHLKRLYWRDFKSDKSSALTPSKLPPLSIDIEDFYYNKKHIGKINLETVPLENGIQIKELNLSSPLYHLESSGLWKQGENNASSTSIVGNLETQNMGQLLTEMNATGTLVNGKGNVSFSFKWPSSPFDPDIAHLAGHLKLDLAKGRIINLSESAQNEIGLGKVLNLFSLQTLPRLVFNFGDFVHSGFSFDIFEGDFTFKKGIATSHNIHLDGSIARVDAKGEIDYLKKNYDLTLEISPYLTSSLPAVAVLAGGPVIGAAAWVLNKMISPGVSSAVKKEYHVQGSWQSPEVVNLPMPETPTENKNETAQSNDKPH